MLVAANCLRPLGKNHRRGGESSLHAASIQLFQMTLSYPNGGLRIHWNFAYWSMGNVQVCIFAREEFMNLFSSQEAFFRSFIVEWLRKVF